MQPAIPHLGDCTSQDSRAGVRAIKKVLKLVFDGSLSEDFTHEYPRRIIPQ